MLHFCHTMLYVLLFFMTNTCILWYLGSLLFCDMTSVEIALTV